MLNEQETMTLELHGLDTVDRVCFYEQDFYVLSNFSAFTLQWCGLRFDTLEAAYHWEKFPGRDAKSHSVAVAIMQAPSAHVAFQIAQENKDLRRSDWDDVKVDIMRQLLRAKASQHEYVMRKLLATGDRDLVENSWRDDYWGWGPNRDGQNMLGQLWMEVRAELRATPPPTPPSDEARAREVLQATFGPYDFLELESGSYVSVDTAIAAMLAFAHPAQAGEDAR